MSYLVCAAALKSATRISGNLYYCYIASEDSTILASSVQDLGSAPAAETTLPTTGTIAELLLLVDLPAECEDVLQIYFKVCWINCGRCRFNLSEFKTKLKLQWMSTRCW